MSRPFVQKFPHWVKLSFSRWQSDNAMRMAAALAYYTVFSLAPLILAAISVAGLFFGPEAATGQIYAQLKGALGASVAASIEELVKAASKPAEGIWGAIVAFLLVLLGASGVFGELKDSLNVIWRVPKKESSGIMDWIRGRFLSITMVLGVCFLLLVSLVVNAGLGVAAEFGTSLVPGIPAVMQVVTTVVSFGMITVLFALLFKYLPDTKVTWHDVWIGSAVTAFLFTVGKTGLEIYIAKASPASVYGAAGTLALVLIWVYYSAQIFFMGAEFTAIFAQEEGSRSANEAKATLLPGAGGLVPGPLPAPALAVTAARAEAGRPATFVEKSLAAIPQTLGAGKKKLKPLDAAARLTGAMLTLMTLGLLKKHDARRAKLKPPEPAMPGK